MNQQHHKSRKNQIIIASAAVVGGVLQWLTGGDIKDIIGTAVICGILAWIVIFTGLFKKNKIH